MNERVHGKNGVNAWYLLFAHLLIVVVLIVMYFH